MTAAQTLSQKLKAAREDSDYLPNFTLVSRKLYGLLMKATAVNGTAKCFVENFKMRERQNGWRDAAVKSDNDALHSQSLLQDFSQPWIPSPSAEVETRCQIMKRLGEVS